MVENSTGSLLRKVPERSDSEASFQFLEQNYDECLRDHKHCHQGLTILPKRVVDISSQNVRLFHPEQGTIGAYAALSYCWGGKVPIFTTRSNLTENLHWDKAPPVFRDATTIARKLGIDYLWIDALCIIQDDVKDWEIESSKMAAIYENARLTIAASSSTNPTEHCLTERDSMYREIELALNGEKFLARRKMPFGIHAKITTATIKDPMDYRAWVLQEGVLATRTIAYTGGELQWRCNTLRVCECKSSPTRRYPLELKAALKSESGCDVFGTWQLLVEDYTSRQLTVLDDQLPALTGLATKFHESTGAEYIAGMWKEHLLNDLSWERYAETSFRNIGQYTAPSFSWASFQGAKTYRPARMSYGGDRTYHTEVLDVKCIVNGQAPFGKVSSGALKLCGPTIEGHLSSKRPRDPTAYELKIEEISFHEFAIDCPLSQLEILAEEGSIHQTLGRASEDRYEPFGSTPVQLISLYTLECPKAGQYVYESFLILGRSMKENGAYERLGIATARKSCTEIKGKGSGETLRPFECLVGNDRFGDLRSGERSVITIV